MNRHGFKGFTLIELLVVIAIIGVLSTLAIVALGNARTKARDSKRVADVTQITKALELYYADNSSYPTIITLGSSLKSPDGLTTYMSNIPSNPTPRNDGNCGDNNYTYASTPDNTNYSLNFCLGNAVSSTPVGINSTSNSGIGTAPGLVGWYKFDEGSGVTAYDSSVSKYNGTWSGTGSLYTTGKVGAYAGIFNGTDNSVNTSYSAIFGSQSFSLAFWVNLNVVSRGTIIANRNIYTAEATGFILWEEEGGGVGLRLGDGTNGITTWIGNTPAGSWYHIVVVVDRENNIMRSYINSAPAASSSIAGFGNIGGAFNLQLGYGWVYYSGSLDDVRIYDRALSSNEVSALYNGTKR